MTKYQKVLTEYITKITV